jgi:uncharacterized protein YkwD
MQDANPTSFRSMRTWPHSALLTGLRTIRKRGINWSLALSVVLAAAGCDSRSEKSVSRPPTAQSATATQSPTAVAEIPQLREIPADSLLFAVAGLKVAAAFPGAGESRVALVSPVNIEFVDDLMPGQNLAALVRITAADGTAVSGAVSHSLANSLLFRPTNLWAANTQYRIELDPTLMAADGRSLGAPLEWTFTTIADVYTTPQSVIDLCMSDLDVEMLAAVNRARSSARLCDGVPFPATGKLVWNCLLQEAALTHSQDMAEHNFFEHTGSDGSIHVHRILRTGYAASAAGENLAAGHDSIDEAMKDWLTSTDGHCETLMGPLFTEFGSGYTFNESTQYQRYWTQNFARPNR